MLQPASAVRLCRPRWNIARSLVLPLLAALMAAGCAGSGPAMRTEFRPFDEAEVADAARARDAMYRLQVGDVFGVDYKFNNELDQSGVTVMPDGRVSLQNLESVRVAGLTIPEVDSLITASAARDYVNPDLVVTLQDFGGKTVYVLGEVESPGQIRLPPERGGLLEAVAMAGGFGQHAHKGDVLVIRVGEEGFTYYHYDVAHLEKEGLGALAATDLRPYDVVYVPRSAIGDLNYFHQTILGTIVSVSRLFWDVYAIANIDKIDNIYR